MQESLQRNDQKVAHARIFAKDHDQEEKPYYWNERSEDHNKPHQKVEALSKRDVLYNHITGFKKRLETSAARRRRCEGCKFK